WVDMAQTGVDILITAPQKGWSGSPGAGYVMLNQRGRDAAEAGEATSFSLDLAKWLFIAEEYRKGNAPYHATMPTDTLTANLATMKETVDAGRENLRAAQIDLGSKVRTLLADHGMPGVAQGE